MKAIRNVLILVLVLQTNSYSQANQRVTMWNPKNGEYSYGTIYNPNYDQQDSGPSVLEVILNASQKSDELEFKKKMAAEQQAAKNVSQKQAAQKQKLEAEMRKLCTESVLRLVEKYDTIKGLQPYDKESLEFRKQLNELLAGDPYQAVTVVLDLEKRMNPVYYEILQKQIAKEYQTKAEENRPQGLGERVKNAFNALFPKEQTPQANSQIPPQASQFNPTHAFENAPNPYQQILDEEAKGLNKKR